MQPISELLEAFRRRDIAISLSDGKLKYKAPEGALTAEDFETIRSRRQDVVDFLNRSSVLDLSLPPFVTRNPGSPLVPSFSQEILWTAVQRGWFSECLPVVIARFPGSLDVEAMGRAVAELERQHEILRTRFSDGDGTCRLILDPPGNACLERSTLLDVNETDRENALHARINEIVNRSWDIKSEKPLRAHLVTLDQREYALVITVHHVAGDAKSRTILREELIRLYDLFSRKKTDELAPRPVQYSDYASWQRGWLTGLADEYRAYWRNQLSLAPSLNFPDDPESWDRSEMLSTDTVSFELSAALIQKLDDLAQRTGKTRYVLLTTGFTIALTLWTGQAHLIIGSVGDNRCLTELARVVGPFMALHYIRSDLSGNPSFDEASQRILDAYLRALSYPWLSSMDDVVLARKVKVQINYVPRPQSRHGALGHSIEQSSVKTAEQPTASVPANKILRQRQFQNSRLRLVLSDNEDGGILANITFDEEMLGRESVENLAHQIRRTLEMAAENPRLQLSFLA